MLYIMQRNKRYKPLPQDREGIIQAFFRLLDLLFHALHLEKVATLSL